MSLPHTFKRLLTEVREQRRARFIRPRGLSMESLGTRSLLSSVPSLMIHSFVARDLVDAPVMNRRTFYECIRCFSTPIGR
jgi:hypothetical protein